MAPMQQCHQIHAPVFSKSPTVLVIIAALRLQYGTTHSGGRGTCSKKAERLCCLLLLEIEYCNKGCQALSNPRLARGIRLLL